jgi:hypothetical protein
MAGVLTRAKFAEMQFTAEDRFTSYTNMYVSQNYEVLRGMYFHIPNESATSDMMRIKLFSMGVMPGVPDFCFLLPKLWFLELKIPGGVVSKAQDKLHKRWKLEGFIVRMAYTPVEVIKNLEEIVGPPNFRV